ncbi:hypothetical protein PCANC_08214 [Puccinia coronata f. sp. avenae]|uniref:Uncharacterized protein n=1 Tax=Puccinia coronata f. sp. avenae TaxID=200324 RepID=A0A2N5VJ80_9BASI|nr:hypothetical protein PCANC_13706 [Puccinia coronata f. sp. avenae]PLW50064.1 hypothetical protein PCANC_08214 [Puccinia coronata f. sp. avenae]PLW50504.1 hypothetical protein PCASD_01510 [Puccinia coronata f. sp. avenae]
MLARITRIKQSILLITLALASGLLAKPMVPACHSNELPPGSIRLGTLSVHYPDHHPDHAPENPKLLKNFRNNKKDIFDGDLFELALQSYLIAPLRLTTKAVAQYSTSLDSIREKTVLARQIGVKQIFKRTEARIQQNHLASLTSNISHSGSEHVEDPPF